MNEAMSRTELEHNTALVTEINPLGFGQGAISYDKQKESGELPHEVDERAVEYIMSGELMHDVTDKDDGCIDGRPAIEVLFTSEDNVLVARPIENPEEHEREKVAGGGLITALAMKRSLDAPSFTADEDIHEVSKALARAKVYCGAHTGAHGHGEATDCGANDKFDKILANGVLYRNEISATTESLLGVAGLSYNPKIFNETVLNGWSQTLARPEYFEKSTGRTRFTAIEESIVENQAKAGAQKPLSVSKHLDGDHKEDYIILNYQEDKTFSQAAFHKKLAEDFPGLEDKNLAQAFVVDIPRIVKLAKALTADRPEDFETALYAGIAYQLATAATLTDGTLRTFVVQ